MPFQVSYSRKQQQLITLRLLSAGVDQVLYCGTMVQLQAEVDDVTALPGHTIEWDQLDGTPTALNDANTLHPWYPLTDRSDKIFRIWLDRGTPYEQHKDVNIFHTPTGFCRGSQGSVTFSQTVPCDPVPCDSIIATVIVTPPPVGNNLHDTNVPAIITVPVQWGLPTHVDLLPLLTNMKLFENGIDVQNYSPTDTRLYNGGLNTYEILAEFNVRGKYIACMSCTKDFTGLIIPSTRIINDTMDYAGTQGGVTFSEVRYGNLNQRFEDTVTGGVVGGVTFAVTRFDPSGIGG